MGMNNSSEIWITGASGRAGRAIAAELVNRGRQVVLVGRNQARLAALDKELGGGARTLIIDGDAALLSAMAERAPAVLVNTVGPFAASAEPTARTCLAQGVDYVDLANELAPVMDVLGLDGEARAAGCTLATGAGFGVVATEAVALAVRGQNVPAESARVAAMPTVDGLGPAVLASVIDTLAIGGRQIVNGQIETCRLGTGFALTPLPDGSSVGTTGAPTGELEAARRASGARNVIAATSEVPSGRIARALLPLIGALVSVGPIRRSLLALVARFHLSPPASSNGDSSWAHAELTWADGTVRQGWLRTGEGYAFTAAVAAEVACSLADGQGRPGAYTPASLLGASLAERAGGELILDQGTP